MRRAYSIGNEVREILKSAREALDRAPYPYSAARFDGTLESATLTVWKYLGSATVPSDPALVYGYGIKMLSGLEGLRDRIVCSIVAVGEQVEEALGLSPLPDPSPEAGHHPDRLTPNVVIPLTRR
jgi:hypothetical protein